VGVLKILAVLIAALGMAAVESIRAKPGTDEDVALFVGSAHPLPVKLPTNRRRS
jgi:hypothetical protein